MGSITGDVARRLGRNGALCCLVVWTGIQERATKRTAAVAEVSRKLQYVYLAEGSVRRNQTLNSHCLDLEISEISRDQMRLWLYRSHGMYCNICVHL